MDKMNTTYQDIITLFVFNTMLHHVGMLWVIETNQHLKYDMDKHNSYWMISGPWYNTYICKKLHGNLFESFIRNARTDRYDIICFINAYGKNNPSEHDDEIRGSGYLLPSNSTTEVLVFLIAIIYFIGCWIQALEHNVLERCYMYIHAMVFF